MYETHDNSFRDSKTESSVLYKKKLLRNVPIMKWAIDLLVLKRVIEISFTCNPNFKNIHTKGFLRPIPNIVMSLAYPKFSKGSSV